MEIRLAMDFDGTLVDCRNRQMEVLRAVAPEICSGELDEVWHLKRFGHNTVTALESIGIKKVRANEISGRWQNIIEEPFWLSLDVVFDGVHDSLSLLRSRGLRLSLLTARCHSHWLERQLETLGLRSLLDDVFIVRPATAAAEKAERLRNFRPIAMIGDSESDGLAASESATRFFAVETGQRSREFMATKGFVDGEKSFQAVVTRVLNTSDF